MIENDAEAALNSKFKGQNIDLNMTYVKRLGWGDRAELVDIKSD